MDLGSLCDLDQLLPEFRFQLAAVFRTENVVALVLCGINLPEALQKIVKRVVNGDFPFTRLGLPGFLAAYADPSSLKVNVVPLQVLQLSVMHPRIEECEVDRIQLGRAGFKKLFAP